MNRKVRWVLVAAMLPFILSNATYGYDPADQEPTKTPSPTPSPSPSPSPTPTPPCSPGGNVVGPPTTGISYPGCSGSDSPQDKSCAMAGGPFQEMTYCENSSGCLEYRTCCLNADGSQTFQQSCTALPCGQVVGTACNGNPDNGYGCTPPNAGPPITGPAPTPVVPVTTTGWQDLTCKCTDPKTRTGCVWTAPPPVQPGGSCGDTADCAAGSSCVTAPCQPAQGGGYAGGVCRKPPGQCVGEGQGCSGTGSCCAGTCTGSNQCYTPPSPTKPVGSTCSSCWECPAGCINGTCAPSPIACTGFDGNGNGVYPPNCCTATGNRPTKSAPCCPGASPDPVGNCQAPTPTPSPSPSPTATPRTNPETNN